MQGFSEVFGNLISIPFVKYIGVKKTGVLFNAVAGLSMILTIIMLEVDPKRYSFYHESNPKMGLELSEQFFRPISG